MSMFENDSAENRLKHTAFVVEATHMEQQVLWEKHSSESRNRDKCSNLKWEEQLNGWIVTVGHLGKWKLFGKKDLRPVCVQVHWAKIEGQLVMFWYQCSQVTDSVMAEAWIEKHFKGTWDGGSRRAVCDAQNFHHCVQAIREIIGDPERGRIKKETQKHSGLSLELSDAELTALDALCASKEMSRDNVLRASLRLYQAVAQGYATVELKDLEGAFGCGGED